MRAAASADNGGLLGCPLEKDGGGRNHQNSNPASRAASARAATRPTVVAACLLAVAPPRRSLWTVDAAASVRPLVSSMTWAEMCLLDRNTARRGRAGVPTTVLRTRRWRR